MANVVSILVRADGSNAVRELRRVERSLLGVDKTGSAAGGRLRRALGTAVVAGTRAAAVGVAGLGYGLYKAVSAAGDFEQQLNVLKAVTGATGDEMQRISALSIQLGKDVTLPATSAQDAAVAMTELAKGGLSVRDSMAAAKGALQLAAAGEVDAATAASLTATALNEFHLAGTSATKVADLLAGAANASAGNVTDFAEGLQFAGTASHAAGQSITLTVAALAEMANAGLSGSVAGTALANALRALQAPSAKAQDAMKKFNLSVYDAHGNMKPLDQIAATFTAHLGNLTQKTQNATLAQIFGTRSVQAARIVFLGGQAALNKYADSVGKSGNASRLAEARMKGFRGALQAFQSNIETIGITIGLKLLPAVTELLRKLNDLANSPATANFANQAVQALFSIYDAGAKVGDGLANLSGTVGFIAENWKTLGAVIAGVTTSFLTYKAVMIATAAVTKTMTVITLALNTAEILLAGGTRSLAAAQAAQTTVTKGAAASQIVFNSTILASKAGLIGLGIAITVGVVAAMILLRRGTDTLGPAFDRASSAIQGLRRAADAAKTAILDLRDAELNVRQDTLDVAAADKAEAAAKRVKARAITAEADAQLALNAARAGGDPAAIADAEKKLAAARRSLARATTDEEQASINQGRARQQQVKDEAALTAKLAASAAIRKALSDRTKDLSRETRNLSENTRTLAHNEELQNKFGRFWKTTSDAQKNSTGQSSRAVHEFSRRIHSLVGDLRDNAGKLLANASATHKVATAFGDSTSPAAKAAHALDRAARAAANGAVDALRFASAVDGLTAALGRIPSRTDVTLFLHRTTQLTTIETNRTQGRGTVIKPATGGIVTGGIRGVDSVPALLTPGEIVLNRKQQMALLHGGVGGGEVHNHFHFPNAVVVDGKTVKQAAKLVEPHIRNAWARRG